MGKFINIPLPLVNAAAALPPKVAITNSSTTTAAAAGKLTDTGGTTNFSAVVSVGDIVFPTGSNPSTFSIVTAVDSDSVLSISGTGTTLLEANNQAYEIFTSASAHSVKYSAQPNVRVGDVVINSTVGLVGKVTQVTSDEQVLTDSILFNDNATDTVIIISQNGKGNTLVSLNNIAKITPTAGGAGTTPVVINYKTKTAGNDVLSISIDEAQAAYSWQLAFEKEMVKILESPWCDVVGTMPLIESPSGSTVPLLYSTGVVLA